MKVSEYLAGRLADWRAGLRRRYFLLMFGGLLVLTGFFLLFHPGDPAFQGVRLSVWLKRAWETQGTNSVSAPALHQYKVQATRLIIRRLEAQDSPLKLKCIGLLKKQTFIRFQLQTADEQRQEGLTGCRVLGPEASGAIPALTNLLWHTNTTRDAAQALAYIGPESVRPLLSALSAADSWVRRYAASALGQIGSETNGAVPALIQALGDPQFEVRSAAAEALAHCAPRVPAVIPALSDCLAQSTNTESRTWSTVALKFLGPSAKAAVPVLLSTVRDPNWAVSGNSMSALAVIDRAAAMPLLQEWLKDPFPLKPIVASNLLRVEIKQPAQRQ